MKSKSARRAPRYHLRFQILPGPGVEEDAAALVEFCREHAIEEVVLFYNAEEWNQGLLSRHDEDVWFDTVSRAKKVLDAAGLSVSLNPWATTLHRDQGRRLPADRGLQPAVSPYGEVAKGMASFADPAWRKYISEQYGRFAALGLRILWIEDDWRILGHSPLTWGLGFEPHMIERFAAKVGQPVTREELVKALVKPGEPHPWRKLWLEAWREAQLEAAAAIRNAVAAQAPRSTVGLMSGYPWSHAVEGRRWKTLFAALTIGGRVAHRPHFAGSHARLGQEFWQPIALLDMQKELRPAGCEVAPELENYPFTPWGRSDTETWAQMALCQFLGSDAILLDLFPFAGNRAQTDPEVGVMLDRSRAALAWIGERFESKQESCGVGLPWREDAQEHVRTEKGESLTELDASSVLPASLLMNYGVPTTGRLRKVNAVFGSLAWAFSDDEIGKMLKGGLIVDAKSAEILCARGYSADIGLDFVKRLDREEGTFSIERITRDFPNAPRGHYLNMYRIPGMTVFKPRTGAEVWTEMLTPEKDVTGPAMTAFENARGGRVVVFALADPGKHVTRGFQRQALVQAAVRYISRDAFESPIVTGSAHLLPMHFAGGDKEWLVILNGLPDDAKPEIHLPRRVKGPVSATLLKPLAAPSPARIETRQSDEGRIIVCRTRVPYLGYLALSWRRK